MSNKARKQGIKSACFFIINGKQRCKFCDKCSVGSCPIRDKREERECKSTANIGC